MADSQLVVEVWSKRGTYRMVYRGMVRRGEEYLYAGQWLDQQRLAGRDGTRAASEIARKERRNVRHK